MIFLNFESKDPDFALENAVKLSNYHNILCWVKSRSIVVYWMYALLIFKWIRKQKEGVTPIALNTEIKDHQHSMQLGWGLPNPYKDLYKSIEFDFFFCKWSKQTWNTTEYIKGIFHYLNLFIVKVGTAMGWNCFQNHRVVRGIKQFVCKIGLRLTNGQSKSDAVTWGTDIWNWIDWNSQMRILSIMLQNTEYTSQSVEV